MSLNVVLHRLLLQLGRMQEWDIAANGFTDFIAGVTSDCFSSAVLQK
jgi:hypothetical protein